MAWVVAPGSRARGGLLAGIAALACLPGLAAEGSPGAAVLDDPAGDTVGPAPAAAVGFIDVTRVQAAAAPAGLDLAVTVASLQTDALAPLSWELWLGVDVLDVSFDVVLEAGSQTWGAAEPVQDLLVGDLQGRLVRLGDGVELATFAVRVDAASRTFQALVPWDGFETPGGSTARPGDGVLLRVAGGAWHPLYVGTPHNPLFVEALNDAATRDDAAWPDGSRLVVPLPPATATAPEGPVGTAAPPPEPARGRDAPGGWLPAAAALLGLAWARRQ